MTTPEGRRFSDANGTVVRYSAIFGTFSDANGTVMRYCIQFVGFSPIFHQLTHLCSVSIPNPLQNSKITNLCSVRSLLGKKCRRFLRSSRCTCTVISTFQPSHQIEYTSQNPERLPEYKPPSYRISIQIKVQHTKSSQRYRDEIQYAI